MKSLQDTIYNWLTIKVVCDARPTDNAASDTFLLFDTMLKEDHQLKNIQVEKNVDKELYFVTYEKDGEVQSARFPIELIDVIIQSIEGEPEKFPITYDE